MDLIDTVNVAFQDPYATPYQFVREKENPQVAVWLE
jgi:hypothetical protein